LAVRYFYISRSKVHCPVLKDFKTWQMYMKIMTAVYQTDAFPFFCSI